MREMPSQVQPGSLQWNSSSHRCGNWKDKAESGHSQQSHEVQVSPGWQNSGGRSSDSTNAWQRRLLGLTQGANKGLPGIE
jgi:hypothetical protein